MPITRQAGRPSANPGRPASAGGIIGDRRNGRDCVPALIIINFLAGTTTLTSRPA
jgi:hypothetical protein